ncbi:unnamed protein product [marine sediment metagenome]|uniref:Uncharacterized protein n=1 Tax=marine sediment metagenome TaxID=412755 RepID=X1K460_9ZZZZ
MELNTLKKLRFIVPGILLFIQFVLFFSIKDLNDITNYLELHNVKNEISQFLFFISIIFIGILYYTFDIRKKIFKRNFEYVENNIKNKLLKPYENKYSTDEINNFKKGSKLINIFFYLIDNDASLKEKAKIVNFNGLIWTSLMDLLIISFFGFIIFFIRCFVIPVIFHFISYFDYSMAMAIANFVITFISAFFVSFLTEKHVSLGNEQLEIIHQIHKKELDRRISDLL